MANRSNTFLLKRSNVPNKIPPLSGLTLGEIALNTADAKLYTLYTEGLSGATEVREIGWNRIHRTGDTVTGNFNFYGDIQISGSTQPNGYALSVTGDTNLFGNTVIQSGLTASTMYVDYIDFNPNAIVSQSQGRINWDSGSGTLNVSVGDSGTGFIDLQVGQEEIVRVFNSEANTLQKGEIVYVVGSNGNRPSVKRALALSDAYSVTTLGMVDRPIASLAEGYVTTFGIVSNLNTNIYSGGTPIWLSPTTLGGYTSVKPIAPEHTVFIGYVIRQHPSVGSIFINISNGWELDEIHDVRISGVTTGDLLIRSSYNGSPVWINSKKLIGNYTISGNTSHIGNFNITGNTTQSGSTFQLGNFNITGNTNQLGNTSQIGNFNITGNTEQFGNVYLSGNSDCTLTINGNICLDGNFNITGNTTQSGSTFQLGNFNITGNTNQLGNFNLTGNTFQLGNFNITGNTNQLGNFTIRGNTFQNGNFTITGNTTQSGNTTQVGNYNVTGNTNQLGYNYIVSATTGCTLAVTGTTCLTGPLNIVGPTFMSGDFCMNNMNSGGVPTGTNCLDTTLIPSGTSVLHQFQGESGILAHIGDLATGEPNSRGYTYFENNATLTSFVASGTGVYTEVIGAPNTFGPYNNLFTVTTGATTATTNKLTYNYPPATGETSATYLKFTVSLTLRNAQNQQLTFQVRRRRAGVFSFIPIGMSTTPQSNNLQGITFNGISDSLNQDEFQVVVKNDTGSNPANSIIVVDLSFSMFT